VEPHALYRRWLHGLWHGELEIAEELIAERFVGHWPDREVRGRGELVDLIAETRRMFADLTFELEVGPIAEGDLVAGRWSGVGRSAEGAMRLFGNDLLRIEDGRFAEYWVASWAGS
jgi:hypothetical protein